MILDSDTLPPAVGSCIEDSRTPLAVSVISHWELHMLIEKGRVERTSYLDLLAESDLLGVVSKPLTAEIAILSRQIALNHQDPADRFIAATAIAHRATLATRDAKLLGHSWLPTI